MWDQGRERRSDVSIRRATPRGGGQSELERLARVRDATESLAGSTSTSSVQAIMYLDEKMWYVYILNCDQKTFYVGDLIVGRDGLR